MTGKNLNVRIVADASGYKRDIDKAKQATKEFGNEAKSSTSKLDAMRAELDAHKARLGELSNKYSKLVSEQKGSTTAAQKLATEMNLLNTKIKAQEQSLEAAAAAHKALRTAANQKYKIVDGNEVTATNKSMTDLKGTLQSIRNLQMADVFTNMATALTAAKGKFQASASSVKMAFEEIKGAFNFENFDVGDEGIGGIFQSMKIQGKEAATSLATGFKNLGAAIKAAMGTAAAAVAGVIAVVIALVALTKNAITVANRLSSVYYEAQKVGLTVRAYEEWGYIMGQVGVEADALTDALKTLADEQNAVRDGDEAIIKAFSEIGITAEEAMGMSQQKLFEKTIKGLQGLDNQVQKTSVAYRIFGEDAAQLTNIINLNNQEMDNMIENFYLLGGSASDSAVSKSRSLSAAISNLKLAWQGLSNTLGEIVMPALTTVVNGLMKAVVAVNMFVRTIFGMDVVSKGSESMENAANNAGSMAGSMNQATQAAEKLKRATQGFDELNVLSSPVSTSAGSSGSNSGGGYGSMGAIDYEGLTADLGLKEMSEWFEKNAETIKNWTTVVVAATAAWNGFRIALNIFGGEKIGALGFGKLVGWLGAFIALVKEGGWIATLAAAFPKVAAAVSALGGVFAKIGAAIAAAAKAVAAFVAGLAGWQIALIIAAIALLASGIYFLVKNWDAFVQKIKEFGQNNIVPILDEFRASFAKLWGAIQELGAAFVNLGDSIWDALPDWLQDWLYNLSVSVKQVVAAIWEWIKSIDWLKVIGTVIEWIGGIIVGVLGGVIAGAIQAVINLVESAVQIISGAIQLISGILSLFVNFIAGIFSGDFSKCKDSAELIWKGIKDIFHGAADAVIGTVWGLIQGIINFFVHMWDVLVGHSIVPETVEAIIAWFFKLPKELLGMIDGFVKSVIGFFKDMANKCGDWAKTAWTSIQKPFNNAKQGFANIWANIKAGFGNVSGWFETTFSNAWKKVKDVFSSGGKVFDGIKDGILNGLKNVINALITGINKVISVPFKGINDALKKIKNVSIAGIKPFDWMPSISIPEIPKLATGGIAIGDTLAHIGEGGKREAVLPLDQNTGWMDMLADRIAARQAGPAKIILKVGEKELGYATIDAINGITKQTGGLKLHLV